MDRDTLSAFLGICGGLVILLGLYLLVMLIVGLVETKTGQAVYTPGALILFGVLIVFCMGGGGVLICRGFKGPPPIKDKSPPRLNPPPRRR